MPAWSAEQVFALAPDAAAASAGRQLAEARNWPTLGCDDSACWGECQGSGAKPYQVQIDLTGPAFKCSCPSRKFPCKHGIGLLLLLAAGRVTAGERPAWVEQWMSQRTTTAEKKATAAQAKPVDAAAQAKRRDQRLGRVADGIAALRRWMDDLARAGIATLPAAGPAFFDEPARRLIDAQAPGAARRVRELADTAGGGPGWQDRFARQLGLLHLLCRAFENRDGLPETTREDVLAELGLTPSADVLAALPKTADAWQVVAQQTTVEDKLNVQRTWLYGRTTGLPALVFAYAPGQARPESGLTPGTGFEGELTFYPGNGVRAAVGPRQPSTPLDHFEDLPTLDALCAAYADRRARHPWLGEVVWPVREVVPTRSADRAYAVIDAGGRSMPAGTNDMAARTVLAVSGGRPITLVVGYDGETLRPLTLLDEGRCVNLTTVDAPHHKRAAS